jgi:hypothetical protein
MIEAKTKIDAEVFSKDVRLLGEGASSFTSDKE